MSGAGACAHVQATAGYGPSQGNAGFAGAGSSYGQQQGSKYGQQGAAGGYGVQGGMYAGPQRARGARPPTDAVCLLW